MEVFARALSHSIPATNLVGRHCCLYRTDEENEVWRNYVSCVEVTKLASAELKLSSSLPGAQAQATGGFTVSFMSSSYDLPQTRAQSGSGTV